MTVRERHTYYRCPRCPKMYVREDDIDREFLKALGTLRLDDEILGELVQGLKESLVDETRFHAESLAALTAQDERLQKRLKGLYQDKLDGEVDLGVYRRKSTDWRAEQTEVLRQMENHQKADQNYLDEGVSLLELIQHLESTYKTALPAEKRDILKFLISNRQWIDGILTVEFRKPFSYIAETVKQSEGGHDENGGDSEGSTITPPISSSSSWLRSHTRPSHPPLANSLA